MITLQELLAKNARIRAEREQKLKEQEEQKNIEEEKIIEKTIESKKGKKKKIVTESADDERIEKPENRNYMVVEDIENINDEESDSSEIE